MYLTEEGIGPTVEVFLDIARPRASLVAEGVRGLRHVDQEAIALVVGVGATRRL